MSIWANIHNDPPQPRKSQKELAEDLRRQTQQMKALMRWVDKNAPKNASHIQKVEMALKHVYQLDI